MEEISKNVAIEPIEEKNKIEEIKIETIIEGKKEKKNDEIRVTEPIISIKDLICHDEIIPDFDALPQPIIEDNPKPLVNDVKIDESKKSKPKSNKSKKSNSKHKKNDGKSRKDVVIKNTKSLRWSEPIPSLEFSAITPTSPKSTYIKLKQPSHKSMNNIQNLTCIDSNALFVMDFHSHLTNSKIGGYLLGTYYNLTNSLHISEAYPLLQGFSTDPTTRAEIDNSVRELVKARQKVDPTYVVCGWYYSNVDLQPEPTIQDVIDHEIIHQNLMDISHPSLFLSMIISPFYDPKLISNIESSMCLFRLNTTLKSPDNISPPARCEFKKCASELSQSSLDKITLLAYHAQKSGSMLNMSMKFWSEITLLMKLIASIFQHIKLAPACQNAMIDYITKITTQSKIEV